jgi:hypothetical protein
MEDYNRQGLEVLRQAVVMARDYGKMCRQIKKDLEDYETRGKS